MTIPKLETLFIIVTLILAVSVRTYRLNAPLADWHSWRQADTAAVSRNFIQERFNLLYPQSDSLWALSEHQLPNPNRYFMNEFPLYNGAVAVLYHFFGINHIFGRVVSIAMSTLGLLYLLLLTRRLFPFKVVVVTGLFYALDPYNVYYGRVFMPDPSFVALSIISLYYCLRYVESRRFTQGLTMATTLALAMLVKPYAIFMTIPLFYWIVSTWGLAPTLKSKANWLLLLISFTPLTLWRWHLLAYPEGSFASHWLLNGDGIRFKGSFFRWIIFDRFNRLIFATGGFVLFIVGIFRSISSRKSSLIFVWLFSVLFYITVFAKGNVNHDYYQLPVMPVGSVLVALGFWWLVDSARGRLARIFSFGLVSSLLILSLAFGWFEVRGFFNINNPAIVEAGKRVDALLPKDAVVIAPYQGDPAFLYQTNRNGWPVGGNIDERITSGATYYVTTSFDDEFAHLKEKYGVVEQTDHYGIIKLSK